MAILATMGVKKVEYADVNSTDPTQMPEASAKWTAVDVYQDTCTFVDKDPTTTTHKSETSSKKITLKTKEGSDLTLSIMDPSMQELADLEGGTYNKEAKTYTEPETAVIVEKAWRITPQAGLVLNIPCSSVTAKKNTTYSATGITLLNLVVNPTCAVSYKEGN